MSSELGTVYGRRCSSCQTAGCRLLRSGSFRRSPSLPVPLSTSQYLSVPQRGAFEPAEACLISATSLFGPRSRSLVLRLCSAVSGLPSRDRGRVGSSASTDRRSSYFEPPVRGGGPHAKLGTLRVTGRALVSLRNALLRSGQAGR